MTEADRAVIAAITSLRPGAAFNFDYGKGLQGLVWMDTRIARPTDAEIEAEMSRPPAPFTLTAERLDQHLQSAINDFAPPKEPVMRGMKRLATLSHSIVQQLDAEADKVADELVANQERAKASIGNFRAFSQSIGRIADDVDAALGQLTNDPIAGSGA